MKKLMMFGFTLLMTWRSFAADFQQEINAPVKSVIVYLSGAEISQTRTLSLEAGRNKIVFTGLSDKLISKSVQVNVSDDISILSVSDQINYLTKENASPRIKQLKDSIQNLNDLLTQLSNETDAYENEKKLLAANVNLSGKDKATSLADLKAQADFYLLRIKTINEELSALTKRERKLNEVLLKANQQLIVLDGKLNRPTTEVSLLLMAQGKTNCTIELKYIVTDAGWAPDYDLKAEDINKPVELKYRAKVFNNTGIDWHEVKLRLSTADPMRSVSKPKLDNWYLNYQNEYSIDNNSNSYSSRGARAEGNSYYADGVQVNAPVAPMQQGVLQDYTSAAPKQGKFPVQYEQIQVSELSADFDIKIPYSVPSDAKPYIVDVTTYNLPATYKHYCAPKTDKSVYLLARITGWEDLDLIEGPANVYYGGTYVGQSYINTRSVEDTLDLSLGRDNKVLVTRVKQKDFTSHRLVGTTKRELFAYEISVKNNRKIPVQIELIDQLPISQQGDIVIEEIELYKAEKNALTGELSWKWTLQPDEVKKINLSFAIKYPKNKAVNTQKMKQAMRAKF